MDNSVILVVGNDPYKKKIVNILQKSRYGNLVKDTTNLCVGYTDIMRMDVLRQWISVNALRRIDGLALKFVHAFGNPGYLLDPDHEPEVELVRVLFEKCQKYVLLVAEGNFPSKAATTYSASMHVEEPPDEVWIPQLESQIKCLEHIDVKRIIHVGPAWKSERVILFGRTGSGKSTIAQMLIHGELLPESGFEIGSSARGVTSEIIKSEGRGWHVTDTPGFGEPKEGTVPTADAVKILKKFILDICGVYSHFVYVMKYNRLNVYDEKLWNFFRTIFRGAELNFSVVITNCKNELSESDMKRVTNVFSGCSRFIPVDFCPREVGDDELEEENIVDRKRYLQVLEDTLAGAGSYDISCDEGDLSKESLRYIKRGILSDVKVDFGCYLGPVIHAALVHLMLKPMALGMRIRRKSEIDENFVLLPQ
jgi:GTP-binding protein EngB required for normal cell division